MDAVDKFIVDIHNLLGHDKAAAFLGQPAGDKETCLLCRYERGPTEERRQAVEDAFARRAENDV